MDRSAFRYAANYCEENVWHLCQCDLLAEWPKKICIVAAFSGFCEFHQQRAAAPGQSVWWDYHVVLFVRRGTPPQWEVWDLDSRCGFPVTATEYCRQTFPHATLDRHRAFAPRFKFCNAEAYVSGLASDRSHMRTADGRWLAPPPEWPPIGDQGQLNLSQWLDVSVASPHADQVLSLAEVQRKFCSDQPER